MLRNETALISCKFSSPQLPDLEMIGVVWYQKRQGIEVKLIEILGDPPKSSFPSRASISTEKLRHGDASLHLPGVQLEDAGEYRCEVVVTPSKGQGSILLNVVAQPRISLILKQASVKPNKEVTLNCTANHFFPENITIRWEKKSQNDTLVCEVPEDIVVGPLVRNKDHTFSISSTLKLKALLEDNLAVYQCVVEHPASGTFQSNVTLNVQGEVPM